MFCLVFLPCIETSSLTKRISAGVAGNLDQSCTLHSGVLVSWELVISDAPRLIAFSLCRKEITTSVFVPALPADADSNPVLHGCRYRQETIRKISRWSKSNTSYRVWAEVWARRFFQKPETTKP